MADFQGNTPALVNQSQLHDNDHEHDDDQAPSMMCLGSHSVSQEEGVQLVAQRYATLMMWDQDSNLDQSEWKFLFLTLSLFHSIKKRKIELRRAVIILILYFY